MLKAEQVPKEAEDGLRKAMYKGGTAKEYIAAALNAWPGLSHVYRDWDNTPLVCLPLPTEKQNG